VDDGITGTFTAQPIVIPKEAQLRELPGIILPLRKRESGRPYQGIPPSYGRRNDEEKRRGRQND